MATKLELLKKKLNPNGIDVILGAKANKALYKDEAEIASHAGPVVYSVGVDSPEIHRGTLFSFGDTHIGGKSVFEEGSFARQGSRILNSIVRKNGVLMDFVTLIDSFVDSNSVIAHASNLFKSEVGKGCLLNLAVTLKNSELGDGGDIGPLFHSENEILPTNITHVGGGGDDVIRAFRRRRALSNADALLVPSKPNENGRRLLRHQPHERTGFTHLRPLSKVPRGSEVFPGMEPTFGDEEYEKHTLPIFSRFNREPQARIPGRTFVDHAKLDDRAWETLLDELFGGKKHNPMRHDWLTNYDNLQRVKQVKYLFAEAERYGDIVWYSAPMQAEVLQLSKLGKVLEKLGEKETAKDISNIVKAKLYLLGAYEPEPGEIEKLDKAYTKDIKEILTKATVSLEKVDKAVEIELFPKETIHAITVPESGTFLGETREKHKLTVEGIKASVAYISGAIERIASLPAKVSDEPEVSNSLPSDSSDVSDVQSLRAAINKNGIDVTTVPEGTRVYSYDTIVPVISDKAILYGADVVGAVHITEDESKTPTRIEGSSIRSEQTVAPITIISSTLNYASVHTATREQERVYIFKSVMKPRSWVHGAQIENAYTDKGSVVGDESGVTGVVTEFSLVPGQSRSEWTYITGNFGKEIKESDYRDAVEGRPLNDEKLRPFVQEFIQSWSKSEFSDLDPFHDKEIVIARVQEIRERDGKAIEEKFEKAAEKYGDVFKLSPQLQADILNLKLAANIIASQDTSATLVKKLGDLAKGIEYLVGIRPEISSVEASILKGFYDGKQNPVEQAMVALHEIAGKNESIHVAFWPDKDKAPLHPDFDETREYLKGAINPQRNNPLSIETFRLAKNHNDIIDPVKEIDRRLHKESEIHPEYITLAAQQLDRIQGHIAQLVKARQHVRQ